MIIEGNVSVKASILGHNRKVNCLYVDDSKHDKDTSWIIHRAEENNIEVKRVNKEMIDELASGRTHGGLLADVEYRNYQDKEVTLNGDKTFIVVLEGVEDPFNLGYVLRSLYSAGCSGVVIRQREWKDSESVIIKSSAGASEYINIVMSDDIPSTIRWYKENGVKTYAAMRKDAISYLEGDYTSSCLIAIGGEMRGLSSKTLKEIEQNIYIPYANDFRNALNAAGASAVLGFEVFRQRVGL